MIFKFVEIDGILRKLLKKDDIWFYKNHFCKCGCKNRIHFKDYHSRYGIPDFIYGHQNKGINNAMYGVQLFGKNNGFYGKHHTKDFIKKMSEKTVSLKTRKKMSKSHKGPKGSGKNNGFYGKHHNKAVCKLLSKAQTELWKDINYKKKQTEAMSKSQTGKSNSFYGKRHTKKAKDKIRKANSGKNAPNWQGGISFKPYCEKFNNELKQAIRRRDHYTCQRCGKRQKKRGRRLSVHHVHFDKENCYPDLIALCLRCNFIVNYRRNGSEKRFMKNLKERNLLNWYMPKLRGI